MNIPLVTKTRRFRSTRPGLWVLHILGPSRKVRMILPTTIIRITVRTIRLDEILG